MSPSLFVFSFAFVLALFMACGGPRTKYMNLLDNMGPSLRDEGLECQNARPLVSLSAALGWLPGVTIVTPPACSSSASASSPSITEQFISNVAGVIPWVSVTTYSVAALRGVPSCRACSASHTSSSTHSK